MGPLGSASVWTGVAHGWRHWLVRHCCGRAFPSTASCSGVPGGGVERGVGLWWWGAASCWVLREQATRVPLWWGVGFGLSVDRPVLDVKPASCGDHRGACGCCGGGGGLGGVGVVWGWCVV
jgi:hypothetical protein